jgi:hypothetical protein
MEKHTLEELAMYTTIAVLGALQEAAGMKITKETVIRYYEAILLDLRTGSMERSCDQFRRITEWRPYCHCDGLDHDDCIQEQKNEKVIIDTPIPGKRRDLN